MFQFDPSMRLPSARELPDSDETPVDNELQNLAPNLLDQILALLWHQRDDWFMGVDMGMYVYPEEPYKAIVPDAFLALQVPRLSDPNGRLSYVLWEERIMPVLALELVSETYRGEYEDKLREYERLGVRYYAVYNPLRRRRRPPLEVYELIDGRYQLLSDGPPFWMEAVGLGLGFAEGEYRGWRREWLYWYSREGERHPTPEEQAQQRAERERQRAEQAQQQAERERQRAEQLAALLRARGIDPDQPS
jgi:Uma2 family endonuclease